ncbi:MAG: hypothetical protein ACXVKI_10705 [Flavisolibacter sp.]
MSVSNKHLATFLLGAAAAFGAYKYMNLTDEEKEKLASDVKEKANRLKKAAQDADRQAMDYFKELKTKGGDLLKEHMPKVEEYLEKIFKGESQPAGTNPTGTPSAN